MGEPTEHGAFVGVHLKLRLIVYIA
jgi:hypothetical protein